MIYMEPSQLGWEPLVQSWIEHELPESFTDAQRKMIQVITPR